MDARAFSTYSLPPAAISLSAIASFEPHSFDNTMCMSAREYMPPVIDIIMSTSPASARVGLCCCAIAAPAFGDGCFCCRARAAAADAVAARAAATTGSAIPTRCCCPVERRWCCAADPDVALPLVGWPPPFAATLLPLLPRDRRVGRAVNGRRPVGVVIAGGAAVRVAGAVAGRDGGLTPFVGWGDPGCSTKCLFCITCAPAPAPPAAVLALAPLSFEGVGPELLRVDWGWPCASSIGPSRS